VITAVSSSSPRALVVVCLLTPLCKGDSAYAARVNVAELEAPAAAACPVRWYRQTGALGFTKSSFTAPNTWRRLQSLLSANHAGELFISHNRRHLE
jgi:hypothetical protein